MLFPRTGGPFSIPITINVQAQIIGVRLEVLKESTLFRSRQFSQHLIFIIEHLYAGFRVKGSDLHIQRRVIGIGLHLQRVVGINMSDAIDIMQRPAIQVQLIFFGRFKWRDETQVHC